MSVLLWWKPATAWWAGQVWKATLRYCLHFSGDRSESDSRSVRLSVTHGILQAKILEGVAFPFSGGSSQPRDWTQVSRTAGGFFTSWATREAKNTGVVSQSLLQRIFPTQESKWDLLHCRQILYQTTLQILQFLLLKYYQMSLIFFLSYFYVCMCVLVTQSCLNLCNPMNCIAHQTPLSMGIFQVRILEWIAIPFSRGSSQPRDRTLVSCFAGRFFTIWASREALILFLFNAIWIFVLIARYQVKREYNE